MKNKDHVNSLNEASSKGLDHNQGKGQKLYEHAKTIIPGGTQLFSKRPELFAPDLINDLIIFSFSKSTVSI